VADESELQANKPMPDLDYSRLMDVAGVAVLRLESPGRVTGYNVVSQRLFGWTVDSGIGRSLRDLVVEHPDTTAAQSFALTLEAGRPWSGTLRITSHDRGDESVPATTVPVDTVAGAVVEAVLVCLEVDSALWQLLTGGLDGWLVMHRGGHVGFASPQVTHLLGGTDQQLDQVRVAAPLHPGVETLGALLAEHRSGDHHGAPLEFRSMTDQGASRWIEAVVTGTRVGGPLDGVVWRLRDVTGRRRTDHRHEERSTELQGALDSRVVIEQAKGFLAGRDGDTPEVAFRRLRQHARDHNLALREVARLLMARELTLGTEDEKLPSGS
jgi:PAS domain-containing protein